ncbi:amino acid ABC transporter permease [Actinomyces sp. Z16]|uniref:amino acid ABC transporter permease n=1 Tax=Actinomyces sp. Z16 TaxID=2079536 RepID=UPI0011BEB8BD
MTIFRGTPMMVQAAIVYYAGFNIVRSAMPNASITEVNQRWSFFMAALLTVSLNSAAYLVEVLRGGVGALNRGQREAAVSLGFSNWQTMIKVIFPQAVRNSLPSIGNELVNNIKGTSVLTIIGYTELMFATSSVAGFYYKYLANYLTAAVIYLILTLSLTWLLETSMRRIGIAQKEIAA